MQSLLGRYFGLDSSLYSEILNEPGRTLHHDALILIGEMEKPKQSHLIQLMTKCHEMKDPSKHLAKIVKWAETYGWMWERLPTPADLKAMSIEDVASLMELASKKTS